MTSVVWLDHKRCGPDFESFSDARARAVCACCPVWEPCFRAGAGEREGRWGGLTVTGRRRLDRLIARYSSEPESPHNGTDVRYLAANGMPVERIAVVLGVEEDVVTALAERPPPKRPRRATRTGGPT